MACAWRGCQNDGCLFCMWLPVLSRLWPSADVAGVASGSSCRRPSLRNRSLCEIRSSPLLVGEGTQQNVMSDLHREVGALCSDLHREVGALCVPKCYPN